MGITFFMTLIAWVFFRAESTHEAVQYINGIFSSSLFSLPEVFPAKILLLIIFLILSEWLQREKEHGLHFDRFVVPKVVRWGLYYGIFWTILYFHGNQQEFIYFQF